MAEAIDRCVAVDDNLEEVKPETLISLGKNLAIRVQ